MNKVIESIFSASFLFSVIRITTPLMYGAMGALICKQGGVLHIAFASRAVYCISHLRRACCLRPSSASRPAR